MALFGLAEQLGMTVATLAGSLTLPEWHHWLAYWRLTGRLTKRARHGV